ncbi:hypothetical protein RHMOL_Rhmol07G0123100 [Rhododendron molle]|uniref:Uncharacterized protein n=1 Tax=Rhododendron molle TaxID=49168 RepID=A0ACC0N0Y4_RHOML|nr:hypothetical protein RHMOL_Rhmol07G0123100 [Rhododendron molle]
MQDLKEFSEMLIEIGYWVTVARKIACESSLEAEIWGIYRGLTIILEKSMTNINLESDSLIAVRLINEGNSGNHPQSVMINDAHAILSRTKTTLTYIYQEANQCADHLARLGIDQNEDLVVSVNKPLSIRTAVKMAVNY